MGNQCVQHKWNDLRGYAFPLFKLIPSCLAKIKRGAEVIFIAYGKLAPIQHTSGDWWHITETINYNIFSYVFILLLANPWLWHALQCHSRKESSPFRSFPVPTVRRCQRTLCHTQTDHVYRKFVSMLARRKQFQFWSPILYRAVENRFPFGG